MKKNIAVYLFFLSITVFVAIQTCIAQSLPSFVKDSLDIYAQRALTDWQIPGVAICIVKDGKVVWMKGYGVKELGSNDKVDENTLFMIGSNTKAFTATALAMLAAEKKLSLDDKVKKWLPEFNMKDQWVANNVIIRDILCHRLGMETFQGDFMYWTSDLSSEEVLQHFAKLTPVYSFRSKWGYTNAGFMTAGMIIPKVTDTSWADFLKARIFTPLGMNNTIPLAAALPNALNKAAAHTWDSGRIKKIPYGMIDNLAPAGSISSSINDLSKWMIMQLNNGTYQGKQIVPQSAILETRKPASILGNGGHPFNEGHFALYGLGWLLEEYNGREIVSHTGGVNGFVTSVTLLPEEKLGIVVLTNTDANEFYEAAKWEILDAFLNLPYRNYSNLYLSNFKSQLAGEDKMKKAIRDTIDMHLKPDLPLNAYAGKYVNNAYGEMNISVENGKLILKFQHHPNLTGYAKPLGGNRFWTYYNDPIFGTKTVLFSTSATAVNSVTMRFADFVEFTPYEFKKIK